MLELLHIYKSEWWMITAFLTESNALLLDDLHQHKNNKTMFLPNWITHINNFSEVSSLQQRDSEHSANCVPWILVSHAFCNTLVWRIQGESTSFTSLHVCNLKREYWLANTQFRMSTSISTFITLVGVAPAVPAGGVPYDSLLLDIPSSVSVTIFGILLISGVQRTS